MVSVRDLESGASRTVDLGVGAARAAWKAARARHDRTLTEAFRRGRADRIDLLTGVPVAPVLVRHMEQRARMR